MNLDKLKEAARKFEQREEWRKAIEVYLKAIQEFESGSDPVPDPSIYNRVGDLEMKAGDSPAALKCYEQAAELYAEQGFFNNAIALCGKILRVNPGRTQTYLRLAQLHARKNVVSEAKRNLLEYIERMNSLSQLEEAFRAVKLFADQFAANQEIRLMLSELLRASSRTDEARDQLERLALELEARGDSSGARRTRERLHAIDSEERDPPEVAANSNDLVFIDTSRSGGDPLVGDKANAIVPEDDQPIELVQDPEEDWGVSDLPIIVSETAGLEDHAVDAVPGLLRTDLDPAVRPDGSPFDLDPIPMEIEEIDPAKLTAEDAPPLEGLTPREFDPPGTPTEMVEGIEVFEESVSSAETPAESGVTPVKGLVFLTVDENAETSVDLLEERVHETPDNGAAHLTLARALFDTGARERGLEEFERALATFESQQRWEDALQVSADLIRVDPDAIPRYQKTVELAYRSGSRKNLVDAYLQLADALVRVGVLEAALNVYWRVLEHDPDNTRAQSALATLAPAPPPRAAPSASDGLPLHDLPEDTAPPPPAAAMTLPLPPPSAPPESGFIDLGALILDDSKVRDTRMRVEAETPVGDEDKDFLETLAQFKRGIEENLDSEDFQAHYDLGIAFKEMGLLDEAIAQFQKALRSPDGRLRSSEALGISFYEKGRHAIAEAVLRRAVENLPGADDEKIGLIYWLGRAVEEQGRIDEAVAFYERALAVDIRFLDLSDRIQRLSDRQP